MNTGVGEEYAQEQTCTSVILKGGAMPVHDFMSCRAVMQTRGYVRHLERVNTFLFRELCEHSGRLFLKNTSLSRTGAVPSLRYLLSVTILIVPPKSGNGKG